MVSFGTQKTNFGAHVLKIVSYNFTNINNRLVLSCEHISGIYFKFSNWTRFSSTVWKDLILDIFSLNFPTCLALKWPVFAALEEFGSRPELPKGIERLNLTLPLQSGKIVHILPNKACKCTPLK